jgi:hypothetical protein
MQPGPPEFSNLASSSLARRAARTLVTLIPSRPVPDKLPIDTGKTRHLGVARGGPFGEYFERLDLSSQAGRGRSAEHPVFSLIQ